MWRESPEINYNTVYNAWKIIDLNVKPDESVVILTSPDRNQDWNNLLAFMVIQKGAQPIIIQAIPHVVGRNIWKGTPPESGWQWTRENFLRDIDFHAYRTLPPSKVVSTALESADIVINNYSHGFGHGKREGYVAKKGKTILMPDVLGLRDPVRFTDEDIKLVEERVIKYGKMFDEAKTWKVITDGEVLIGKFAPGRKCMKLKYVLDEYTNIVHGQSGLSGEAMSSPMEGTGEGIFVINGAVGHIGNVKAPLKCTIEKGMLVKVEPEDDEVAKMFLQLLNMGNDPNNKNLAEFSIGCNHLSRKSSPPAHTHEVKKSLGTVHIAFGGNIGFGGEKSAFIHIDVCAFNPTVYLDDKIVVEKGKLLY